MRLLYTNSTPTRETPIAATGRGRGFREDFARFFEAPTREGLRDLLRDHSGEANELDFKKEWPESSKLAKHVLGVANFGGGCIVIGMEQGSDGALEPVGLSDLTDKTEVLSGLDNYVPDTLMRQVDLLDFTYAASEYPKLKGKSFQVLFVENDPTHLPFLALRDGQNVDNNKIYIRHGVATDEASHDELQHVLSRRIETGYSSQREIDLRTHLEQLKVLYEQVTPYSLKSVIGEMVARAGGLQSGFMRQVPNPSYPEEHYETFVAHAIARKKRRIEMELDIEDIPASDTD